MPKIVREEYSREILNLKQFISCVVCSMKMRLQVKTKPHHRVDKGQKIRKKCDASAKQIM